MAVLACQSLGLIDVGGIGSIEGDPQKYESPVNHLGLLGALQAAQAPSASPWRRCTRAPFSAQVSGPFGETINQRLTHIVFIMISALDPGEFGFDQFPGLAPFPELFT